MHVPPDPRRVVHVARQPILDRRGRVFGYELLYRGGADDTGCRISGDLAASRVLTDSLTTFDLATITAGRRAFVNVTRQILVVDAATLLPPKTTVLEVLEDVVVDAEVVDACRRLHRAGYALALDDFSEGSGAEALLPYVKFVKVDVLLTPVDVRKRLAMKLPSHVQVVAECVETAEMAAELRGTGYHLFQGFYFCRPMMRSAKALPTRRLAYLKLFSALNRSDLTLTQLEDIVEHDVSLSYRVLRAVNSAAFALAQRVNSIRQALVLMGLDQLRKWAAVWALAGVNTDGPAETASVALIRARCCELVGKSLPGSSGKTDLFMLGLCSLLDAILGQPMSEVVASLPLSDEIQDALLGRPNRARSVLDAVIAYERGDWEAAAQGMRALGPSEEMLCWAYADALRWARELSNDAVAA